jgi:rSAM/selenodomain-associated transferase 1
MINKCALGVFFRIPEYGKVKRRLAAEIGDEAALQAYKEILDAALENVLKVLTADLYGFYDGGNIFDLPFLSHEGGRGSSQSLNLPLVYRPQESGSLGERLYNAFEWLSRKGYSKIVLAGSDSPDMPASYISDAFKNLESRDLVLGPTEDGGYYLIGMRGPHRLLMGDIPWGTGMVLQQTLRLAAGEGISYSLLPEWYDIDTRENLLRWKAAQNLH